MPSCSRFFRNDMGFGGNNGFTDFKDIVGFDLTHQSTRITLFAITAVMLGVAYVVCTYIVSSRAGRVIQSVRDAESRARFIGYRVESYKLWVFVFSAVLAGIAGQSLCTAGWHHQPQRIPACEFN